MKNTRFGLSSLAIISGVLVGLGACDRAPTSGNAETAKANATSDTAQLRVAPVLTREDARDIHSYAEPAVARVHHVELDLIADFAAKRLSGTARLSVQATAPDATLTLDTAGLEIEGVNNGAGQALAWSLGEVNAALGAPLRIKLTGAREAIVKYRTRPEAEALQWLQPAQTADGKHPYLFSQGQAILTRTWIPTQDSPGIRQTWAARIAAPEALTVVMSAEMSGPEPAANGQRTWRFKMNEPVAPYLIALAIGDIQFKSLGQRTGIYAESKTLDAAAVEFADMEQMIVAAEKLYGPYRWGRYDLLVLPPSFPFGGMENPRLTFATPTVIAGDKSLVALVAHELAHSWSGNLVTNATWADFWLNEGFTSYFENRIMEAVYGVDQATMLADLAWDDLQAEIANLGGSAAADTRLHIDLTGRNPDDGMTDIPYDKGATLLRTLEAAVGHDRWDAYLRGYFDRYAFAPQTSAGFLEDLRANLIKDDASLEASLKLDEWVYGTGLPGNAVHLKSSALARADAAAVDFAAGTFKADVSAWTTSERVRFLNKLPRKLSVARLTALQELLNLNQQGNSEVRFAWLKLAVANRYEPAAANLEQFLTSMGRRKFVAPLFTDLMAQGAWGKAHAERIYAVARPGYHSVTTGTVDKLFEKKTP